MGNKFVFTETDVFWERRQSFATLIREKKQFLTCKSCKSYTRGTYEVCIIV